jgi:protein ImuB
MLWLAIGFPSSAPVIPPWPELACRLGRYTPRVVLRDDALLAELAASVRLFGGLERLVDLIRADLAEWQPLLSLANTPRAALWLVRSGREWFCPDRESTCSGLRSIPWSVLDLELSVSRRLTSFGLVRLGELMDLPRASLATRLGAAFVMDLARALGEIEDPQLWFEFPEVFEQKLELPAPVDTSPALLFAARRLLIALVGWLAARNVSVSRMVWQMDHGAGQQTVLPLEFSTPVHALTRIERVLVERLGALSLPAPVLALSLRVDQSEPRDARTSVLFEGGFSLHGEAFAELLDRLRARLGPQAVQTLQCHPDHRPELASKVASDRTKCPEAGMACAIQTGNAAPRIDRPLWLLDYPEPLSERNGRLYYRTNDLQLLSGPERIESGWWDGGDIRRDYFVAADKLSRWLWIFREPERREQAGGWYLHGWFA